MWKKRIISLVLTTILVLSAVSVTTINRVKGSNGTTLYVGGTGPGNHTTIQSAINDASNGDTVFVYSGTYYENVVVNSSISLIGEDRNSTIIAGWDVDESVVVNSDWVVVRGFTITAYGVGTGGITISGSNNIVHRNTITHNNGNGINILMNHGNIVSENTITYNNESGIFLYSSPDNTVTENTITHNNWSGIDLYMICINNTVTGNTITNNKVRGISLNGFDNIVTENTITYNKECGITLFGVNNTATGNTITYNKGNGINIYLSNNTVTGNTITYNSGIGIDLYGSDNTIYHNNFKNNVQHANTDTDLSEANAWDNGYPDGGNYWDDYTGIDANGDNIGDVPYFIPGGDNLDRYPLMMPYDLAMNLSISNIVFCSEQPKGYMDYEEQPSATYNPGDTVWTYMNINNLHYNVNSDDSSEIWIKQNLTLLDSQGELIHDFGEIVDNHRNIPEEEDPEKIFLTNDIYIPTDFNPGRYAVQIQVLDKLAHESALATVQFWIGLSSSAVLIRGVPAYEYRYGCAPTAAGMVIGYWDTHGFDNLVEGNASIQTSEVNTMIASTEHYNDYCLPPDDRDVDPSPKPDKSEWPAGYQHSDNCLADFMNTSQSYHDNYNNETKSSHIAGGIIRYVKWKASRYKVSVENYNWEDLPWYKFCKEIDENRPVLLKVDTTGEENPETAHAIIAIGYDNNHSYACYNTWDKSIHWHDFSQVEVGKPWGIYEAVFVNIEQPQVMVYPSCTNWGPPQSVELYIDGDLYKTQYANAYANVDFNYRIIEGGNHEFKVIGKDFGNNVTSYYCYDTTIYLDIGKLLKPIYSVFVDDDFDSSTPGWNIDHFNSLWKGIAAVDEGGSVYVNEGLYYGVFIDKSINLIGEDKNTTIINGYENGDGIYVSADRVNISGFTIRNGQNGTGIYFESSSNNTITGNTITNSHNCIFLESSSNNTITGNTITNGEDRGIWLSFSNNNTITGNTITNSSFGIYLGDSIKNTIVDNTFFYCGFLADRSNQNSVTGNIVNGKPLVYLKGQSNISIDRDTKAGQIILVNCTNITIKNQKLSNTTSSIQLTLTDNCLIKDNTITHNTFSGIEIIGSNNNTIMGNTITHNKNFGMYVTWFSYNNTITGNIISNNSQYGIGPAPFYTNSKNKFYHNNFINNSIHAEGWDTAWDNGYPVGGNYWDNYNGTDNFQGPNQNIPGSDGIGDTPYNIPGGSDQDKYPLMIPYKINQAPIAHYSYTPLNATTKDSIHFTDKSTDTDGDIVSWTWNFDDGTHSELQHPTHNYYDEGTYNVTLQVKDNDGETNITSNVITVVFLPRYKLTASSQPSIGGSITLNPSGGIYDAGTRVTVTATANTPYQFDHWSGDANGTNPLKITMDSYKNIMAHFNHPPLATFEYYPQNQEINKKITFNASLSEDSDGYIIWEKCRWDWDDDGDYDSTGMETNHTWNTTGEYNVTLYVEDNDGLSDTTLRIIHVKPKENGRIPGFEFSLIILSILLFFYQRKRNHP